MSHVSAESFCWSTPSTGVDGVFFSHMFHGLHVTVVIVNISWSRVTNLIEMSEQDIARELDPTSLLIGKTEDPIQLDHYNPYFLVLPLCVNYFKSPNT